MTSWQLQTAKAKFSELIRTAKAKGPQAITLHGQAEAVILSKKDYDRLKKKGPNLVEFLKASPFHGVDLKIQRNKSTSRKVDF